MTRPAKYPYGEARNHMIDMVAQGHQISILGLRKRLGGSSNGVLKEYIERFEQEGPQTDERGDLELENIPVDFRPAYQRLLTDARKKAMNELDAQRQQIESEREKLGRERAALDEAKTAKPRGVGAKKVIDEDSVTILRRKNAELEVELRSQLERASACHAHVAELEASLKASQALVAMERERRESERLAADVTRQSIDEMTRLIAQSKQTQLDGQAVLAEFLAAATRSVAATATQVEQVKATVLRIEARSARPVTV
jgi:hypothetical protein